MKNVVEQVAEAISEIPGNASDMVIARVAIEEYQDALWPRGLGRDGELEFMPEYRRIRASQITGFIMQAIGEYLCDHGVVDGPREASNALFNALYESGAYIVTDADRAAAGLPMRGPYGLTGDELKIMELKHLEAMSRPLAPMIFPHDSDIISICEKC